MCVSLRPAHFSDTIVGVFEGPDGRRYLAYQNTAANLQGSGQKAATHSPAPRPVTPATVKRGSRRQPGKTNQWSFETAVTPGAKIPGAAENLGGNAMILPIPDDVANIELIDTTTCPNFLKDIRSALIPRRRGTLRGSADGMKNGPVRIINFDVYTIVLARNAADLKRAIASEAVPADRRPQIEADMIKAYTRWYPGWAIAVCCFNNSEAKTAKPLLFSYLPTKQADADHFFVPTLDAHDGKVPDLMAEVPVDHTVFVATARIPEGCGSTVFYSDNMAAGIARILPNRLVGRVITDSLRNGDLVFRRQDIEAGVFRALRALPPGAEEVVTRLFV